MSLLAALILWLQAPPELVGTYHTNQIEVGATIELKADGSFLYSLDYGAVSEAAEGIWRSDGTLLHLDSMMMPRDIERSDAAFADEPLAIEDGALVLQRHDTLFTFYRDEP